MILVDAEVRKHRRVGRVERFKAAQPEHGPSPPDRDEAPQPLQHRGLAPPLGLDVHRLVPVHGVHERGEVELGEVGVAEAAIAVGAPLHRGADPVPIAEVDVVAHADLVAVVEDRAARQGEEHPVEELHLPPPIVHQRGETPPDAQVELHPGIPRVLLPHVVALFIGDHLEGQFVVVAQEDPPLRAHGGKSRGALQDLGDGVALLPSQPHEDPGHEREVKAHVAFGALLGPEIVDHVLGPLVGLGQEHAAAAVLAVDGRPQLGDEGVGLRQVLAVGAIAGVEVRNRVETEAVDAHVEPEAADVHHLLADLGIVVVEVRLMAEETMPVVGPGAVVPGPVRGLRVDEDDPGVGVPVLGVRPDVVVAVRRVRRRAGGLEPGMLVGGVIEDEVHDHVHPQVVSPGDQLADVVDRAVGGQDGVVVLDVVAAVAEWGVVERQQPEAVDAQPAQVVEALDQPRKVADAVGVAVRESADQHLVEDGALEPEWVSVAGVRWLGSSGWPGRGHRRHTGGLWLGRASCRVGGGC